MDYATRKIIDEIKLSDECVEECVLKILQCPVSVVYRGTNSKSIRETLSGFVFDKTEKLMVKMIEKYQSYIKKVCNGRRHYLKSETDDCEQFIKIHLCKMYFKRNKYENWDRVVKAVIKRKAIDFSKRRNSSLKNLINETDFLLEENSNNENMYVDKKVKDYCEETAVFIKKIKDCVYNNNVFNEKDRKIIDIIERHVLSGVLDFDVIIKVIGESIGNNKNEAKMCFAIFSKKIREELDMGWFL